MPIYVSCQCGKTFGVRNDAAGRAIKCPTCGAMLTIPGRAATQPEAEPELRLAPDPDGRSWAAPPSSEADLTSAMEEATAGEHAPWAAPAPRAPAAPKAPPAAPTGRKTVIIAALGIGGVAAAAGVIALACSYWSDSSTPVQETPPAAKPAAVTSAAPKAAIPAAAPEAPAAPTPQVTDAEAATLNPAAPAAPPAAVPAAPAAPVEPAATAQAPAPAAMPPNPAATPPQAPSAAPGQPPARPVMPVPTLTKEQQALALLGTDVFSTITCVRPPVHDGPPPPSKEEIKLTTGAALKTINKGPAKGLRPAAASLMKYRGQAQFTITILGNGTPPIAAIQAILGQEERMEQKGVFTGSEFRDKGDPSQPQVTWYHYGWLAFGTVDGRLMGIVADCQKFVPDQTALAPEPVVAQAPAGAPPAAVAAQPAVDLNPPTARELEALRTLGRCRNVAVMSTLSGGTFSPKDMAAVDQVSSQTETTLKARGAVALRATATPLAKHPTRAQFEITMFFEAARPISAVQDILGQENRQTQGRLTEYNKSAGDQEIPDRPVTWYHYGWLAFAVSNGGVVAVLADCQKLSPDTAPAPAAVAAQPPADAPAAAADPEKEMAALRVLGRCRKIEVMCAAPQGASKQVLGDIDAASARTKTWLESTGAPALRATASSLASHPSGGKFEITIFFEPAQALTVVQKILGPESRQEQGVLTEFGGDQAIPDRQVTWYHYGWLTFAVADGGVVAVRADCQKLAPPPQAP